MDINGIEIDLSRLQRNYQEHPLKYGEMLSPDEMEYLYIELNLTLKEIAKFTGRAKIGSQFSKAGIQKSKALKTKAQERKVYEKYGVSNPMALKTAQEKAKQTNLEKYGASHHLKSVKQKEKVKKKLLEKYGTDCTLKIESAKNKTKQTNLERYGCENPMQNEEVKNQAQQTSLNKYGCRNPMQNEDIRRQTKQTNLERYGSEWGFGSTDVQAKILSTNLERYGCENPSQRKAVQKRIRESNLKNHGVEWVSQREDVKEKIKQTNLKRYGTESFARSHLSEESLKIISSSETLRAFIESQGVKTVDNISKLLGLTESPVFKLCHKYNLWNLLDHYTSSYELELQEMFPFMQKTKKILYPYEIDLYSEEHKFGIEFNGNYWHSEVKIEDSFYHQKKSLLAEEKGIFLYHIWEYEWQDSLKREIILSQIKNYLGLAKTKIFARKCDLKEIVSKEARSFLNENHLQGYCSSKINLGLYYEDELVSLMTFGKPRFNGNYEYELLRFCNKKNCSVVGGASKLFKHFIQEYKPKSILSYSHIDKGTGNLYRNLGFDLNHVTDPDYVWVNGEEVLSRYQCQKHKLLAQGFEGSSEKEIMEARGYHRLFGCGNKVWIYQIKGLS